MKRAKSGMDRGNGSEIQCRQEGTSARIETFNNSLQLTKFRTVLL